MLVNEGLPAFVVERHARNASRRAKRSASWGWPSRPRVTTPSPLVQAAEGPRTCKPRRTSLHGSVHSRTRRFVPLEQVLAEADAILVGTPHKAVPTSRFGLVSPSWTSGTSSTTVSGMSGSNGKKVLVTGSAGFIAGYLIEELLEPGYAVTGIDNFSKYGPTAKSYDEASTFLVPRGRLPRIGSHAGARRRTAITSSPARRRIGGIKLVPRAGYDLLAENERILAASLRRGI